MKTTFKVEGLLELKLEVNKSKDLDLLNKLISNILMSVDVTDREGGIPLVEPPKVPSRITGMINPTTMSQVSLDELKLGANPIKEIKKYEKNKLVFFRCKKCGTTQYKFAETGDRVECFNCEEPEHLDLVEGEYICPCCGKNAKFHIGNDNVDSLKCKGCGTFIDMKYHDKWEKYVSLNMIK